MAQSKAKIFISYSRKDIGFVDRLDAALKERGFDPLVDRTEIYALEDWWKRIESLIAQADTVVFVLSPDAVSSGVCQREVSFAASLNKRLAPVVHRRVEDTAIPVELARLNFIFFDDAARFDESMDRLSEALRTDIGWVRKHTEFGEHARRWAAAGRPGPRGLLLHSPLLEEAEHWISSRPEGAPPPTEDARAFIAESRKAAMQRRRVLSGSLAAGLVVALGLAGLAYWQRGIAIEQRDQALITQSRFLSDLSRQHAEAGDQASALLLAMEALPDPKSAVVRPLVPEADDALYQSFSTMREVAVLSAPGTKIVTAEASRDGRLLMTRQEDRTFRIWDTASGRLLATRGPYEENVVGASFDTSGKFVEIQRNDLSIASIDAITGVRSDLTTYQRKTWQDRFNRVIRSMSKDGRTALLNPASVAEVDPETGLTGPAVPLAAAGTDAATVFRISDNGAAVINDTGTVWDAKTGRVVARIDPGADLYLAGVNLSPDGSKLVWRRDASAFVQDITTGRRIEVKHPESEKIKGHEAGQSNIFGIAFSPDGGWLATASADNTARIWDVKTGALLARLEGHRGGVRSVRFLADGKRLVTTSDDGTARIWDAVAGNEILPAARFAEKIIGAFQRKNAIWLVAQEDDNSVTVWDHTHGSLIASLKGHKAHKYSTLSRSFLDREGRRLITSIGDDTARVWDLETGIEISHVPVTPQASMIDDIGFSHDGKLAYAAADYVYVWEVNSGKVVNVIRPRGDELKYNYAYCASFSPDDTEMVVTTDDETKIWDVATGKARRVLTKTWLDCARYSPDGRRIISAQQRYEVAEILDAQTGAVVLSLVGHSHFVTGFEYSPDERLILTRSEDTTARLWDAATGRQIRILTDIGGLFEAHFTPDGKTVLTQAGGPNFAKSPGSSENEPWRGRLWPVFADASAMIDGAKAQAPRCLTGDQRVAAFLDREPPAWCIEMQKWPYQTKDWKDWLAFRRTKAMPPLADTPEWAKWIAARAR